MTSITVRALELRSAAFDRLAASAVVLDGAGVIVDANAAWRLFAHLNEGSSTLTGVGCDYLAVCDRSMAAGAPRAGDVADGLRRILSGEIERFDLEYPCSSATEERWFLLQASAAPVDGGAGIVMFHIDITSHKLLADRFAFMVDDDALTGLPNRRAAARFVTEQLSLSDGQRERLRILSLDITALRTVNELFGRHVGDELIVKVGLRARGALRRSDRLCRTGGSDFVLVCSELGHDGALALTARLEHVMAAPFQIGAFSVAAGVSVAFAESRPDSTADRLLGMPVTTIANRDTSAPHVRPPREGASLLGFDSTGPWPQQATDTDNGTQLAAIRAHVVAAHAHSSDMVMFFTPDGTIRSATEACLRVFGVRSDDLIGTNGLDLIHPDDQQRVFLDFASIPSLGNHVLIELRIIDHNGTIRWLEEDVTNLVEDPLVGCIVANIRDVTQRVKMTQQIEDDRRRLAHAGAIARLGSFEIDLDTGIVVCCAQLHRMFGTSPGLDLGDEPPAKVNFDMVHPDDQERVRAMLADAEAGADSARCTYRLVRPDGDVRWVSAHASRSQQYGMNVVSGSVLDVTEQHDHELAVEHQATHDWLTNLPNQRSLLATLAALMLRPGGHTVAAAVVDIDHMKLVNDRYGHAAGDHVLQAFAARLRASLRCTDYLARVGGNQFAVLRTSVDAPADARALSADIAALLVDPVTTGDGHLHLTASIGATVSTSTDTTTSLLRDADDAMCQSKRDGKNRVTVFDHHSRLRAHRRQHIATALPFALHHDQLHLEYQPIVHIASGQIAGFESLARWEHHALGTIPPDEFIPIAEATGLILPLGTWVLDSALQQLAAWRSDPRVPDELWMAINVSPAQLAKPQLVDYVIDAIARAGVPSAAVHLEMTEGVLMDRVDNAANTILDLQAAGISVSIDDFGTGYSSLSYLSRLPVDTIKIDRSFISELKETGHGTSIVRAMIVLADNLGLNVVAEGIESEAQRDTLDLLGCTYGQGFLWSRSMRPADALTWMLQQRPDARAPLDARGTAHDDTLDVGTALVQVAHASGAHRRTSSDLNNMLRFDSLEIGLDAHKAWIAGRPIDLTAKQFELLAYLASHPGEVFSRTQLLHTVWQSSPEWQNDATVTEHIHRLRTRIEPDPSRPRLLRTIRGSGYCFGPPTSVTVIRGRCPT